MPFCHFAFVPAGDESPMDFCFELFAHITNFFGFKVLNLHVNYLYCSNFGIASLRLVHFLLLIRLYCWVNTMHKA